jgi:hypothetical protein
MFRSTRTITTQPTNMATRILKTGNKSSAALPCASRRYIKSALSPDALERLQGSAENNALHMKIIFPAAAPSTTATARSSSTTSRPSPHGRAARGRRRDVEPSATRSASTARNMSSRMECRMNSTATPATRPTRSSCSCRRFPPRVFGLQEKLFASLGFYVRTAPSALHPAPTSPTSRLRRRVLQRDIERDDFYLPATTSTGRRRALLRAPAARPQRRGSAAARLTRKNPRTTRTAPKTDARRPATTSISTSTQASGSRAPHGKASSAPSSPLTQHCESSAWCSSPPSTRLLVGKTAATC